MENNLKKRLYFIGNIFTQNHPFRDYIIRLIEADGELNSVEYFFEADRNFFAELETRLAHNEKIYVISNKKSFTLVGKLLCTVIDDKLVLKEQKTEKGRRITLRNPSESKRSGCSPEKRSRWFP